MPIDELIAVCAPPERPVDPPTEAQWRELEVQIGTALPSDYRALCEHYGAGSFGAYTEDGAFFDLSYFLTPGRTRNARGALELMVALSDAIASIRQMFPKRVLYPTRPEPGGLVYAGGTTTSHCIYWRTDGHADAWSCVVCDRPCNHWFDWPGDLASLFAAIAIGDVPAWITAGVPAFPQVFRDLDTLADARLA